MASFSQGGGGGGGAEDGAEAVQEAIGADAAAADEVDTSYTSEYTGVHRMLRGNYKADVNVKGEIVYLGTFEDEKKAAETFACQMFVGASGTSLVKGTNAIPRTTPLAIACMRIEAPPLGNPAGPPLPCTKAAAIAGTYS